MHCHDSLLAVVGLALGTAGWLILVSWFPMPGWGWAFIFCSCAQDVGLCYL